MVPERCLKDVRRIDRKTLALPISSRLRSLQHAPHIVEFEHVASFLEAMRLRHDTRFRFLLRVDDARSRRREWRTAMLRHADTLSGVSIENVSGLLVHSSVGTTERHYKPGVKTLQKKLEEEVRKAWARDEFAPS